MTRRPYHKPMLPTGRRYNDIVDRWCLCGATLQPQSALLAHTGPPRCNRPGCTHDNPNPPDTAA